MSKRRGLPERSQMRHDAHFVDQLFRAEDLTVGRRIPITLLDPNPEQPRSVLGDLAELSKSIRERGVLEPILVRPKADDRFMIISGERRYRAALEAGLVEVPCIEMDVTDAELVEIALIENLQRKDLTPFEEADGYSLLRERYSMTHEQIADAVGKSRVTITETLKLVHLPSEVRDACRRADIESKSFLLELARMDTEEEMLAAIEAAREGTANRDLLREQRKGDAGAPPSGRPLPKRWELNWTPTVGDYRVSVVLKGSLTTPDEILAAVRDLARRIETGEVDLSAAGRFAGPKKKGSPSGDGPDSDSK